MMTKLGFFPAFSAASSPFDKARLAAPMPAHRINSRRVIWLFMLIPLSILVQFIAIFDFGA